MNWTNSNHLQKLPFGKYGEYFAKMEFIKHGFDVYSTEVDDKGIDFVVRKKLGEKELSKFFEIQVKSINKDKNKYPFMLKKVFRPRKNLYLALLVFVNNTEPIFALIPSLDWKLHKHDFLTDRDYPRGKSEPEFGVNISNASLKIIQSEYAFEDKCKELK